MPGCSADQCTNSSEKGYQMCRFPKNETRRQLWIKNVNRINWVPSSHHTLCAAHFEDHMWEKTRDGKRRLKSDAIPTIFNCNSHIKKDKRPSAASSTYSSIHLIDSPPSALSACTMKESSTVSSENAIESDVEISNSSNADHEQCKDIGILQSSDNKTPKSQEAVLLLHSSNLTSIEQETLKNTESLAATESNESSFASSSVMDLNPTNAEGNTGWQRSVNNADEKNFKERFRKLQKMYEISEKKGLTCINKYEV